MTAPKQIYLSPPHMDGGELNLLTEAFESNWITPLGPQVDAFEREVCELVGVEAAVALSSGTAALHLALRLVGVEPGDRVLCSTFTFVASASPIVYLGAEPVFVDAERSSWNMSPALLEEELAASAATGQLPRAVVVTDLFGQCADYDAISRTCDRFQVPLIEDAAEALGGTYRGSPAGSFGRAGVFSFNGNKIITTSGGGMLVSDDVELIEQARFLSTQARDEAPHYQHSKIGYNYRMSNLLAALGRGQLARACGSSRGTAPHLRALRGRIGRSAGPRVHARSGLRALHTLADLRFDRSSALRCFSRGGSLALGRPRDRGTASVEAHAPAARVCGLFGSRRRGRRTDIRRGSVPPEWLSHD